MVSDDAMKRLTAWLLTLGIIVAIVADSSDFFFRRPYYEFWDLAANSLAINRAKHFAELYGSYSRWGFHHPGPVFFYVQAFGEWLFYDRLHLCPAPFNAQTLANLCVTTSFFVASLAVWSRWVSEPVRRWFVPLALAVGAVHFGAVSRIPSYDMLLGSSVFSSAWTAHSWVFPVSLHDHGRSLRRSRAGRRPAVARSGGGLFDPCAHRRADVRGSRDFAGVHRFNRHYSPVPAHGSGRGRCGTGGTGLETAAVDVGSRLARVPAASRRRSRYLALFALPMVIDLFLGETSNFHAVLMHMRSHKGEHKSFMRSLFYFGQFAAYRPYHPHIHEFKRFDKAGAYAYLWYHKKIYAGWFVVTLLALWSAFVKPALIVLGRWRNDDAATPAGASPRPDLRDPSRFLPWAGVFALLSIALTLYWGIIQDGGMFYYSGWINFAIYYFVLLIVLAEFCSVLAAGVSRWNLSALSIGPALRWIGRGGAPRRTPARLCARSASLPRGRSHRRRSTASCTESFVHAVQDAKARNPKGIKLLKFPVVAWPTLTGLALEMEREGQSFMVASISSIFFQPTGALHPTTSEEESIMEVWHFKAGRSYKLWLSGMPKWFTPLGKLLESQMAAARQAKPALDALMFYPLLDDVELTIDIPLVDPNAADGATVDFRKPERSPADEPYGYYKHEKYAVLLAELGSNPGCALYGFSDPETWGMWNLGKAGALRLRGKPVGASKNVEICLDAHPFLAPNAHLLSQRLSLAVNGTLLGPQTRLTHDEEVVYTVPGALWNQTFGRNAGAALEFNFPDVASPAMTNPDDETDPRLLGVGLRGIHFRTVEAESVQPALDLESSKHPVELDFKVGGNSPTFQSEGWWAAESWGTWSRGHTSTLHFHSGLVEGTHDVEITLSIHSVMDTDTGIKGQRVRASLGDIPFDREHTVLSAGKLVLTVPSSVWNRAVADNADAELQLDLPDAVSPARIDPIGKDQDQRLLAIGVEQIKFRRVSAPTITSR